MGNAMMNIVKYIFVIAGSLLTSLASAEEALKCRASFPDFGNGKRQFEVRIDKLADGRLAGKIDDKAANQDIKMKEYLISPALNYETDPYSAAFGKLNEAETALIHIHKLQQDPYAGEKPLVSFPLKEVSKIHYYDMVGGAGSKANKFGGTVLFEAYNKSGKRLGRVFRSIMVADCI
ncbi:hypothetical protein DFR42_1011233 [Undibacterium pigrum]|uniref:Uncharacterized protein n=2 Tax=Undibacterium pigrum TaxID=401470 RepID=A0A318JJW3_9BURK|nr:hypothetical protein DFR42_1011233 [Undibacterium pigrum]